MTRRDLPALRTPRRERSLLRRVGKGFVVAGLIVAGFVAYELWVTSFFARRAQASLQEELTARAQTIEVIEAVYDPAGLDQVPFTLPEDLPAPDQIELPAGFGDDLDVLIPGLGELPGEDLKDGSRERVIVGEPPLDPGGAVGRIVIPVAGVDWTVVEGVGRADLKKGAGHMPGTAAPGAPGNAVISGHRTTHGAPFYHLDRVGPGDVIVVEMAGGTHVYQAVRTMVVSPHETWVTGQWEGAWLTLTTCNPRFSAQQRLVVVARLVAGPNASVILEGA